MVIDKKLFERSVKDKRKRIQDKEDLALLDEEYDKKFLELKEIYILILLRFKDLGELIIFINKL